MVDDSSTQLGSSDLRQLQPALTSFLKRTMPLLTLESCAKAIIETLRDCLPFDFLFAQLWVPAADRIDHFRYSLEAGRIVCEVHRHADLPSVPSQISKDLDDDLRVVVHRSLSTLRAESTLQARLAESSARAAVEIQFAYYGRLILNLVLGYPNHRLIGTAAVQEFLLTICRCWRVTLHGAYLAQIGKNEGNRADLSIAERFGLTLQWFHSILRHANLAVGELQTGRPDEAFEALQRAMIVAGVCLGEIASMMDQVDLSKTETIRDGAQLPDGQPSERELGPKRPVLRPNTRIPRAEIP
jgi:hypothetical protein